MIGDVADLPCRSRNEVVISFVLPCTPVKNKIEKTNMAMGHLMRLHPEGSRNTGKKSS